MRQKPKRISVLVQSEEINIFVLVRRKHKLTDLYPQRALLEESRKNSSLIQANDWIDHNYYEKVVEDSFMKNKRLDAKYGTKLYKDTTDESKPSTKTHKIKPYNEY